MNMTFDLAEIEEMMPQQARKQLEVELQALGGVRSSFGQSTRASFPGRLLLRFLDRIRDL